jgi:Type IV secretion system pilin
VSSFENKKNKNMKAFVFSFAVIIFTALSVFSLQPELALAQACQGELKGGICFPTTSTVGLSDKPVLLILSSLMFWLLSIVGIIAIIAFVISGLQYLTSVGDPKSADKAKANMVNSIIGVVVVLSGLIIIQALNSLFQANTRF